MTELHTARIALRPWQRHDDEISDEWPSYNDPFEALWNLGRTFSFTDYWGSYFDMSMRRAWAVENDRGTLIGRISLREIDDRKHQARLGVTFSAHHVGRGLGTEALRRFLDYFFTELNFVSMVLDVAAPNVRAVRCYHRLGFHTIGSDWRETNASFDRRVLDMPRYTSLLRHFQPTKRGIAVEFFEMELRRDEWLRRKM